MEVVEDVGRRWCALFGRDIELGEGVGWVGVVVGGWRLEIGMRLGD